MFRRQRIRDDHHRVADPIIDVNPPLPATGASDQRRRTMPTRRRRRGAGRPLLTGLARPSDQASRHPWSTSENGGEPMPIIVRKQITVTELRPGDQIDETPPASVASVDRKTTWGLVHVTGETRPRRLRL